MGITLLRAMKNHEVRFRVIETPEGVRRWQVTSGRKHLFIEFPDNNVYYVKRLGE